MTPERRPQTASGHLANRGPEVRTEAMAHTIATPGRSRSPRLQILRSLKSLSTSSPPCIGFPETTRRYTSCMEAPSN